MSETLIETREPERSDREQELARVWRDRINPGRDDRRRFEPAWLSALAFAAGKHYLKWDRFTRQLVLDDRDERDYDRYTADKTTQYRNTAAGELINDDDRPEIQFRREDLESEEFAEQANLSLSYGWEVEWKAAKRLLDLKLALVDLGTGAIRCRFDPTLGPPKADVPLRDGQPVFDDGEARAYVATETADDRRVSFKSIHEGRIRWEVLTPFHLLVPPGVYESDDFPWEIVVAPVELSKLAEEYPKAKGLKADEDIGTVLGVSAEQAYAVDSEEGSTTARLKNHAWVYSCYERPSGKHPKGRMAVLAGHDLRVLAAQDELPYQGPDGSYRSGITYFHWWRITGRFWGRGMVEALKDPQRTINRRATQKNEIIDRGMPKVFVEEDALPHDPSGKPLEIIRVKKGAGQPQYDGGTGPGEWMYRDMDELRRDMEEAAGIRAVSLGENPASVTNYSQLALLRENDQVKLKATMLGYQLGLREVVENSVDAMRRYWGEQKQLALAGPDGFMQALTFNAKKLPPFFLISLPPGIARPHSQAALLQLIQDIARYSVESQQPLPPAWLKESYEAGKPLPLPEQPTDDQLLKARHENLMLLSGEEVVLDDFDDLMIHLPEHRSLQIQARLTGNEVLFARVQAHLKEHEQMEIQKAQQAQGAEGGR